MDELEKARKKLVFAAISSIATGVVTLVSVALAYVLYGNFLDALAQAQPALRINSELLRVYKAAAYKIIPGLSVLLIILGWSTLGYMKKRDQQNCAGSSTPGFFNNPPIQ